MSYPFDMVTYFLGIKNAKATAFSNSSKNIKETLCTNPSETDFVFDILLPFQCVIQLLKPLLQTKLIGL